ncbi:hypothetical protein H6F42_00165 [Pseudanabaena sp. FACHB-1998]|uniref:hypothetical protein n=1 Tax=Pseudanabaena sp. FACHB-1998 TaxID=2692858 RepID=UPI0016805361|nr:hypothetical protein [Pseudanabaena sp. FACHB-1998]MBD2175329.1 hypothetical protein [Pseudanabaena sp. FACHB-1998]
MRKNRSPQLLITQLIAKSTSSFPITLLILSLSSGNAIAQNIFGQSGQDGTNGRDGREGKDGQNIKVVVEGKPAAYDLSGTNGEDGEDGTAGRSASSCEQPYRPEYSLIGATGGRGGNAGNGGRGGNGGNATVFYTDIAALKQLEIRNSGGRGGRNGRGAVGGKGCNCQERDWRIKYCTIETERRPFNDAKAAWTYHSNETKLCGRSNDGFDLDFNRSFSRTSEYRQGDWLYRRTNKGISRTEYYSCQNGIDGESSGNGKNGETGNYGRVTLVPRLDIPAEIINDRDILTTAIGKKVPLIKNIWVERRGLARLLSPSSDVADTYTYLKDTARLFYRFEWAATEPPAALGIDRVEIGGTVAVRNENAEIQYQLAGTLEYQVLPINSENLQVVKITGGFNPDRVSAFQLQKVSGVGTDNQLFLSDRGNVRELLKDSQIEVQCLSKQSATGVVASDYVKRRSITFKIPPKLAPSDGAIVNGSNYTLPVGRYCSPWLRADNDAALQISIIQTTKSGAKYTQSLQSNFIVGKN